MNKFRMFSTLTASIVAVTTLGAPWPVEGAALGSHGPAHRLQSASSDPELSPLQELASSIDDLGTSTYPSTYAGVQISNGELDVYLVPGDDKALLAAIAATDSAGLPYTIKYDTRSYATQAATSQWLADNRDLLRSEGLNPGWWGAYPAADAVRVALQTPTSANLAELQSIADQILQTAPTVTPDNYLTVASAVINAQVPSPDLIVVYPTLLGQGQPADAYNDVSPFYGGDQIMYTLNIKQHRWRRPAKPSISYSDPPSKRRHIHCSFPLLGRTSGQQRRAENLQSMQLASYPFLAYRKAHSQLLTRPCSWNSTGQ
jgi:hypothetical protein